MENTNITISVTNAVSLKEAADELGITTMTLWRWMDKGKIIAVKFGRYRMIPKSEIERLQKERGEQ
jgi:excisionase family DNA binding protein